jgi:phage major head subunit gpT-like protein
MTNRANFADLLTPGFRKIFDDAFNEIPMVMDSVFHVETSSKDTEKDSGVTGFGLAQLTAEGAPINYDDPIQMYDKTYTHLKYTLGFKVTREAVDDDLYRVFSKKPAQLARAMRRTAETSAAMVFNRAFNTSYLGGDAKPLASISHPRADAGTAQSNASSTGITLTETNLETGRIAARQQVDDRGMVIDVAPDTLLVPTNLEKTAHLIVDSTMRQGTADNDMNFYKSKFDVKVWRYLDAGATGGSATAWFLLDRSAHQLNFFWRERPQFKNDELFDTEYAVYKSTMRLSNGFSDWRGIWGSKGDAGAYSS